MFDKNNIKNILNVKKPALTRRNKVVQKTCNITKLKNRFYEEKKNKALIIAFQ